MIMKLGKITTNFNKLIKEIYTHVILGPLVIKNTLDSSKKPSKCFLWTQFASFASVTWVLSMENLHIMDLNK